MFDVEGGVMTRRAAIVAALLSPLAQGQTAPFVLLKIDIPETWEGYYVTVPEAEHKKCRDSLPPDSFLGCSLIRRESAPVKVALQVTYKDETINYSPEEIMEALRK